MADRRELLIDAYNVMFAHPRIGPLVRHDRERAREAFLEFVSQSRPADATRVVVVFDAHREPGGPHAPGRVGRDYRGNVHVVFAPETADVWIQRRIREHDDPTQLTVVTSDREILATVRAHGATVLRVSEFLSLPAERRRRADQNRARDKPEHMSRRELEEWERLFEKPRDEE
jgi:predicted RNA-binding protein with PIN domain